MKRITFLIPIMLLTSVALAGTPITTQNIPSASMPTQDELNRSTIVVSPSPVPAASQLTFYGAENEDGSWTLHMGTHTRTAASFDQIPNALAAMYREALTEEHPK